MKIIMMINILKNYLFIYMIIIMMMLILLSSNFKNLHPLMLGSMMFIYSIFISLILNMFNKSNLYSMLMFLILIGGFLIMFLYFNSFAINNKMMFNMNMFYLLIMKSLILLLMILIISYKNNLFNMILFLNNKILEMKSLINMNLNMNNNNNINMLYMKFKNLLTFSLIYLLYTLIIIMKIIFFTNPKFLRKLN
uniref:NADH dehydrogenase subunit 6 n=1 Tax=Saphonecrus sp. ZJUH 20220015 TaxID=2943460 RepID=A0A9E8G7F1_9HYME|nr:NADH dehydrogenase subunit 6 [Saphonecrus sp. ZJUH 20220015]